jgi:hypothetical protein
VSCPILECSSVKYESFTNTMQPIVTMFHRRKSQAILSGDKRPTLQITSHGDQDGFLTGLESPKIFWVMTFEN